MIMLGIYEERNVMLNIFIGILKQRRRQRHKKSHAHPHNIHAKGKRSRERELHSELMEPEYELIEYDYLRYTNIMKECRRSRSSS